MKLWLFKIFFSRDPRVPGDVLAALVDSLYAPLISLALGSASAVSLAFAVALFTDQPALVYPALALAVISVGRAATVLAYRRRSSARRHDLDELMKWQLAYAIGAYAFSAALGALNVVALVVTDDAVVHMLVLTVTTGCTAGAVVRNSGVRNIALGQILFNSVPLCIAAMMRQEPAYYVVAFVFVVFALSAFDICLYQSTNTLRLLLARKETMELSQRLAEQNKRFDAALNNMPQGLCMFDAEQRLVVANARVGQIFRAPPMACTPGQTISELAARMEKCGALTKESARIVVAALSPDFEAGGPSHALIPLPGDRVVAATVAPQEGGGAVVLYDDVTERHQAEARVRYLATHDALTSLPNRNLFAQLLRDKVAASKRERRRFAVLFIDLDRFKTINDSLGHAAGDALLYEVALRLKACLRTGDIAARLGGDEFVVILQDIETPRQAAAVAETLLTRFAAVMRVAGEECSVGASVGVAHFPSDGEDEDTLLRNADAAMYLAKAEGKGGVRLYSPKAKARTLQGLTLENALRHALERDELLVVYQPKRSLSTGAITGVEALLRWRHPEFGLLPPDRFIPLAEETGLIVPIGRWVLETACAQHMKWRARGMEPIVVAVNLSPRQLYDDHIISDISAALEKTGMEPHWLELEITENMVMQDAGDALMVLRAIKETGVRLAIDDFGAGKTSFALIRQIPLDTIKIDRSFVNDILTDPNDRAIAEAIISLGQALKLRVVAEGVETEAQEAFLRAHGCDEIQGYLFSRPLEPDMLLAFAADYNLGRLLRARDGGAMQKSA